MIYCVVDSTFGIQENYAKEKNIEIVNLKLVLDNDVTDEGFERHWELFYDKLAKSKEFPTTSQPSPEDFIDAVNRIIAKDPKAEVIILTISNGLSGTINSATIAAKSFEKNRVVAIDSRTCSAGGRIMVEEVVDMIEKGVGFDEIVSEIEKMGKEIIVEFIPATMEYLKRGGRIGTLSATLASILKIKPIFRFKDGAVSIAKKVLGFSRAVVDMISQLPKTFKKLYLVYIHDDENMPLLKDKVSKILGLDDCEVLAVSPVFGAHIGIGAVGLALL